MSKKSLNAERGHRYYSRVLKKPEKLPFSFVYNNIYHKGLSDFKTRRHIEKSETGERLTVSAQVDSSLRILVDVFYNYEFGETEYTVYFENPSEKMSGILRNVYLLDERFEGTKPILRGNMGDHDNWYSAYEHDLTKGDKYFLSTTGRATHVVFPYFDLVHGNGGTMIALGWAGTWEALFSSSENVTHVKAKTDVSLNTVLMPGEKIRTGLVVMLPYKTRDYDNATNLWREWFMSYNIPKADADGNDLKYLSTQWWAGDTGLPNSDGSISERYFTWKPTLDKLIKEDVVADFRWFDAGWYYDPYGKTVETDWWGTIGSWELDRDKWPDKTFLESNEACHKAGMKTLVWFEPERVTHVDGLVANYGYKEEWSIGDGTSRTNDLGNPDCLKWTLGRITKFLGENGVDMYREDNNSNPAKDWPLKDRLEEEKLNGAFPRAGITENKCIFGHYALWDGIIAYCRENGKCTFVDSCASGGGRNDIESMRRGIPFLRSDFDRTTSSMRLAQSSTFPRWIPFHGSVTKETETQEGVSVGSGSDAYVSRASFLPIYNTGEAYTHNESLDFDLMRKNFNEWKSVRHLLTKDMYVLTPWHHEYDTEKWTAFAYDDPEIGESVLLAFRMENSEIGQMRFQLQFADPAGTYMLTDADTGLSSEYDGSTLKKGFDVEIREKKTSRMIYIKRKA